MRTFADMHARHAFGLEALAEMTGKLLQGAYQRASFPADPEDQDRAILLFDRLSRGFRLTLAKRRRIMKNKVLLGLLLTGCCFAARLCSDRAHSCHHRNLW